jgi:hypothetical protein
MLWRPGSGRLPPQKVAIFLFQLSGVAPFREAHSGRSDRTDRCAPRFAEYTPGVFRPELRVNTERSSPLSSTEHERPKASDVTLKIPRPLYERLAHVIEGTGFRSVTEFAVYVLRDLVAAHDRHPPREDMTAEELAEVRGRLRALGYLED